jgi:hypothetical protein
LSSASGVESWGLGQQDVARRLMNNWLAIINRQGMTRRAIMRLANGGPALPSL